MIISIELMGGLGNQLFQIFNTIAYSLRYNKKFIFQYFETLKKYGIERPTYWNSFLKNLKKFTTNYNIQLPIYREKHYTFLNIPFIERDFKFFGYFQSYKYFEDQYEEICNLINIKKFKNDIFTEHTKYFDNNITISLHFRLGDYKHQQHNHPVMPIEYYINSIQYIINKTDNNNFNILYFCEKDDNEIVNNSIKKLNNIFSNVKFIKVDDNIDDWKQMLLMSLCNHNIIANSSFSWWGAYFNSNAEKIVCYPNIWFGPSIKNDTKDLCPNNWNKIVI